MVLVAPSVFIRLVPFAQTTPTESPLVTEIPGISGFRPREYLTQLGTPSPAGMALGAAAGLVVEPKNWICQASGNPSLLASPVRSPMEALSRPTAKGALCTPLLPSICTNWKL